MRSKTIILSTAAVLALAGAVASPGYARTHHRHHVASGSSTPAERAQTAELNRQQLQQAQTGGSMSGPATTNASYTNNGAAGAPGAGMTDTAPASSGTAPQSNLSTTQTSYQKPGSAGTSAGATSPQNMPAAGTDSAAEATPSAPPAQAPADNSGGTQ